MISIFLQLIFYGLVNRKRYSNRLMIALIFLALIALAFLSGSGAIDLVVLFSLALALCIRGNVLGNKTYVTVGMVSLLILSMAFIYFMFELFVI